jgi:DNA polymerase III subunit alpha
MTFFSHLHVHSEYSLMESTIKIKDLVNTASRNGMKAVALTDKYVMSGAVEFYKEAVNNNIKPIIGCEICIKNNRMLSHLILLARNRKGYGNLCRIVSRAHLEKKGPLPAVGISDIQMMGEGLTGLGCSGDGEISLLIREGRLKEALKSVSDYFELFRGNFFLEIQRYPESKRNLRASSLSEILTNFVRKYNIPAVATNSVHYLTRKDYETYRYLFKIKSMGIDSSTAGKPVGSDEHYFKSPLEMAAMFHDIPRAIYTTRLIADRCNLELFPASANLSSWEKTLSCKAEEERLKKLCFEDGLEWRYRGAPPAETFSRLKKELEIITEMGFCRYFLTAAGIAKFARENNIPMCGKGSSAGSLVSYLLGISDIDPIKNNLYFERFLNRERKEPPDIDIDLSSKKRDRVIKYLIGRYGKSSISRVCTFSTLKTGAAIREAGRILGWGKEDIDSAVKNLITEAPGPVAGSPSYPGKWHFLNTGNSAADKVFKNTQNICYEEINYISGKIKNYPRHISVHPSAFIISTPGLEKKIPLALSKTGEIVSQYDIDSVEEMGLLKIDLISSHALSMLDDVTAMLWKTGNIRFNAGEIKYDDRRTLNLIKKGETLGVFQLESSGIRKLAKKLKPSSLNDITHLISLYRPGPQSTGMVKNFIERKLGREKITYIHRDLEPILAETYGIILYQEQVMRIAACIAGYSMSEADNLRKLMNAPSGSGMKNQTGKFIKSALCRGYPEDSAKKIFKLISGFASYSFVKAHAAAYAGLSYKICYIKAHYPAELISIILTNNSGYYGRSQYIEEARRSGIKIKLPHINKSGPEFSVEDNGKSIRISLLNVKGLGQAGSESILSERARNGNFKDFPDFYYRTLRNCRVPGKAVENLIKTGAFDFTGLNRKQLLLYYHYLKNLRSGKNNLCCAKNFSSCIKNSIKDFNLNEKLTMEEEILGFCASLSPLKYFRNELKGYHIVESRFFSSVPYKKVIFTAGIVINREIKKTRTGRDMILCTMEDGGGMYEAVFFSDYCKKNYKTIMNYSALIIEGRLYSNDGDISLIGVNAIAPADLKRTGDENKKDEIKNSLLAMTESKLSWITQEE